MDRYLRQYPKKVPDRQPQNWYYLVEDPYEDETLALRHWSQVNMVRMHHLSY